MKNIVVAVDGPAGSGKSSISKRVAADLGLTYIDSGALYRSITWYVLRRDSSVAPGFAFGGGKGLSITQEFLPNGSSRTCVNGEDVSTRIRDEEITRNIGVISDDRGVRDYVTGLLRSWTSTKSIIMDGRDIGTVVFPAADIKIYLDASVDVRAERRINEYRELGKNVDENSIKKQIILRDEQDTKRPFGALKRAEDAVYIDTSNMSMAQVIDRVKELVLRIL